jgi:hypothetical protein
MKITQFFDITSAPTDGKCFLGWHPIFGVHETKWSLPQYDADGNKIEDEPPYWVMHVPRHGFVKWMPLKWFPLES